MACLFCSRESEVADAYSRVKHSSCDMHTLDHRLLYGRLYTKSASSEVVAFALKCIYAQYFRDTGSRVQAQVVVLCLFQSIILVVMFSSYRICVSEHNPQICGTSALRHKFSILWTYTL